MLRYHELPVHALGPVIRRERTIIVLDTARPSDDHRFSYVFIHPEKIVRCSLLSEVQPALERLARESRRRWIAGYMTYEAAYGLEEKAGPGITRSNRFGEDLLWFGVYDEPYRFDHRSGKWNRAPSGLTSKSTDAEDIDSPKAICRNLIDRGGYGRALNAVKRYIEAGDVYQINFTFAASVSTTLSPWEFYRVLRRRQPVPFGAFIKTGATTIASFSPELFFMQSGRRIVVKPMKGTAPRGRFSKEDEAVARSLAADPKNRSENVMIVDLLRNDLGRICETGSVRVGRLFEVERHPTLHQMTSTVSGMLRKNVGFSETIGALFPSGSVTGAPKIRAMQIIRELEGIDRGVYCGAIGYASPKGKAVFSVPIRTLEKKPGRCTWRYGVGSGIVGDSAAQDEWRECRNKCDFLAGGARSFRIMESMLFTSGAFVYLREHRARIVAAADYFDFLFDRTAWDSTLSGISKRLTPRGRAYKVRILLNRTGELSWDYVAIEPATGDSAPVVCLSKTPIQTDSPFLFHKTTIRPWYDNAMRLVHAHACFDVLHTNERGELTEGARTNLFVKINGTLYTPPVACGLLPGVLRQRMLASKKCREKILYPRDLKKAVAVYCGNSVRGMVRVRCEL